MSRCYGADGRDDNRRHLPHLVLSLMVQKYIVRGLTMDAVNEHEDG
jgi:hypothetical protein